MLLTVDEEAAQKFNQRKGKIVEKLADRSDFVAEILVADRLTIPIVVVGGEES